MNVVIDIGNTRIKWAGAQDGSLVHPGNAIHAGSLGNAFDALFSSMPEQLDRVIVTNVGGDVIASRLVVGMLERFGVEPEFIAPASEEFDLRCAYADPSQLGADRWAAMVAAHQLVEGSVCVIDAGTTVTFDAVDPNGEHCGGLIFAGPRMIARALSRDTEGIGETAQARLRPIGLNLLATSTDRAVANAAMLALATALDYAIQTVGEALAGAPTVLMTGGDGSLLQSWLENAVQIEADLVLEGLAYIADQRR